MINKMKYKRLPKYLQERWSYDDFLNYRMQEMNAGQIDALATPDELWEREKSLNRDEFRHIFNDKQKFYERFNIETNGKFIGREMLFLPGASMEECRDFCERHSRVVIKPPDMYAGIGVRVASGKEILKLIEDEYIDAAIDGNAGRLVVEEYVNQAKEYMEIYPGCLNTIRVTTFIEDGIPRILFAVNQFGQKGSLVDNDDNTSIWASIDIATGMIDAPDIDAVSGLVYDRHPDTGAQIVGFCNPVWEWVKRLALEIAMVVPECRLVGWDIAVREDYSLEVIEGNVTPELDLYQRISKKGLRSELGIG